MTLSTHLLSEAWLLHLAATYGTWAVLVSVTLEGAGLPVPSESILIAVAALAAGSDAGAAAIVPVILAGAAGAVLGDNLGYAIGRIAGAPLMRRLGLSPRRQRLGRYLFIRYGGRVVFAARFVSILRTCISLLAGATRMPWPRFFAFNLLGAASGPPSWGSGLTPSDNGLGRSRGRRRSHWLPSSWPPSPALRSSCGERRKPFRQRPTGS